MNASVPRIRPEWPSDVAEIHALLAASFPTDGEARLVNLLRGASRLIASLVADSDGAVVGHVAFSPVTAANGAVGAGLAPLAVAESHRRRGVAAELVRVGLKTCREAGYAWAVVLGEPEYYSRFGFGPATDYGLSDEFAGGAAFQAIELVSGGIPSGGGRVRYAPEFASLA